MIYADYDAPTDILQVAIAGGVGRPRTWEGEIIALLRFDANNKLIGVTIQDAQYQADKVREAAK